MRLKFDDFVPTRYPGPVTESRQVRAKIYYFILAGLGFALSLLASGDGMQAFGLGLVFPGAGFLHYLAGGWALILTHVALFVVSVILFVGALIFCWVWNGNIIAPMAVWFLSALGAGLMNHGHSFSAAPLLVFMLVLALALALSRSNKKEKRKRVENLKRRKSVIKEINLPVSPIDPGTGFRKVRELSLEDLQHLRYAYDRALQPTDEWNGFTKSFNSEWQGAGTRYQLSFLCWALSMANFSSLPSMRGYLQQAQLNLIEKSQQPRVWSYWRWERLWGTLTWNPDPFPVHNMMYSGYFGKMIGLYQNATGDLRHDEEGSIHLKGTGGEEYSYDFPKICQILAKQYEKNDFYYISCEPNFMFSICNIFGNTGLAAKSATSNDSGSFDGAPGWGELQSRYRQKHIDEWMKIDGTGKMGMSAYLGLPLAPPGFSDSTSQLMQAAYMSSVLPDVAAFQYQIVKSEIVREGDTGLELADINSLIMPDIATLKKGYGWSMAMFLIAAKEQGDAKTAEFIEKLIEEYYPSVLSDGIRYFPEESVSAHAKMLMGRVATTNLQHDLVNTGSDERWVNGPLLTDVIYPKVQVAKAVSDGINLDLVLYPENKPDVQDIEISQLLAEQKYSLSGSSKNAFNFFADAEGKAKLSIHLDGRTELTITKIS